MPSGSRQPIIFLPDRQTSDHAPSISRQGVDHPLDQTVAPAGGDEMEDDLGVRRRLEDRAAALQLVLQGHRVGDVAVMRDREAAAGELGEEGLDVAFGRPAMG